jgi:hypothetical protein
MAPNYQIYRPEWRGWKPGERKSFFAAIQQHRRADLSLLRPLLRNERGDALSHLAHGLASDFQILV